MRKRFAVTTDAAGDWASDLEVFDLLTGKRVLLRRRARISRTQPGRSDGKTIAVTSYPGPAAHPSRAIGRNGGGAARDQGTAGEPIGRPTRRTGAWIKYTLRHDGRNDVHAVDVKTGQDVVLTVTEELEQCLLAPMASRSRSCARAPGSSIWYAMDVAERSAGGPVRSARQAHRGEGIDGDSRRRGGVELTSRLRIWAETKSIVATVTTIMKMIRPAGAVTAKG